MSVVKVIEIIAESPKSWEDATKIGVSKASKTVKNIKSVWVKDMSASCDKDSVKAFRVTLKLSFLID